MDNILCEPSIAYSTSKQSWTSKFVSRKNIDLIGGYGSYVNEAIMITIAKMLIDEMNWDTTLKKSQQKLEKLAQEALNDHEAGKTQQTDW